MMPNTTATQTFRITNDSGPGPLSWTVSCAKPAFVTSCTLSATSVGLRPGVWTDITVTYSVGTTAGSGNIAINLTGDGADFGATIHVTLPVYTVAVTPKTSTPVTIDTDVPYTQSFTVHNTGTTSQIFDLSKSCTATLTCTLNTTSVTLAPDSSAVVPVSYQASSAALGTTATVGLHAVLRAYPTAKDTGYITVNVPAPAPATPVVAPPQGTPQGATVTAVAHIGTTQAFVVRNAGGSPGTFYLTASCQVQAWNCSSSITSAQLSANQDTTVTVAYTPNAAGVGGTVALDASLSTGAAPVDSGWVVVTVPVTVSVTPDGWTVDRPSGSASYSFSVSTSRTSNTPFNIAVSCPDPDVTCSGWPTSVTASASQAATIPVTYTAGASGNSGTISVTATQSDDPGNTDVGSITLYIVDDAQCSDSADALTISPCGRSDSTALNVAVTDTFTVYNETDTTQEYQTGCGHSGTVTSCAAQAPRITIPAHGSSPFTLRYQTGTLAGSGTAELQILGNYWYVVGTVYVTAIQPAVAVSPTGTAVTAISGATSTQSFTIANNSVGDLPFTLKAVCGGAVTDCSVTSPTSPVTISASGNATATITYHEAGLPRTRGTVALIASYAGKWGTTADTGSVLVTATAAPGPAVAVTPDSAHWVVQSNGFSGVAFFVQNFSSIATSYTLTATCTGNVFPASGCAITPNPVSVQPGSVDTVTVYWYPTQAAGSTGQIVLRATQSSPSGSATDTGFLTLVSRPLQPDSARIDVASVNPGASVDRALCLTIAAGEDAAWECGALRLVHPLRSIRTMNKMRTPTLLYNSQFAQPRPVVLADIALGDSTLAPDTVFALLKVNGATKDSVKLPSRGFWPGKTQRLALQYDALQDSTDVYPYTVLVELKYNSGGILKQSSASGTLIVVNRARSHFGAGWWLAGLEQLYFPSDTTVLWVGGDGSARVYSKVSASVWAAPDIDRPDTLKWNGSRYVRYLPHGLQVQFDVTGRHVATVNRLEHETDFAYDPDTASLLTAITVPPTAARKQYTFWYTAGLLDSVSNPGPGPNGSNEMRERTSITMESEKVVAIRDCASAEPVCTPNDTASVAFGYLSGTNLANARTDRLRATRSFGYDALNQLAQTSLVVDTSQTITLHFRNPDSLSRPTLARAVATYPESAYVRVSGPRTDLVDTRVFWLDRFGEPIRIVDALGATTTLTRADSRWPALVTSVVYPGQRTMLAAYDAQGNMTDLTEKDPYGDGQDAVTHMHYDSLWSFADSIVTPMQVVTTFEYDTANGNRLWQQVGTDPGRKVTFNYGNAFSLLSSTIAPLTTPDSIEYDSLGNLAAVRSPKQYWVTYQRDSIGRDTLTVSPISATDFGRGGDNSARFQQRMLYDALDRDTLSEQIGPPMSGAPEQTVVVRKQYDAEGELLSLMRKSVLDATNIDSLTTAWRYDTAGRVRAEIAPDGKVDSTAYDAASNIVSKITRRGDTLSMTYDALNRLIDRELSEYFYQQWTDGLPSVSLVPSIIKAPYGGITIPGGHEVFVYDSLGNLVEADNDDAQVSRTYYANHHLKTETQSIRTVAPLSAGGNFLQHVYTLLDRYDLDGRRTILKHPAQLVRSPMGSVADSVRYAYDPQTGVMTNVWDLTGQEFRYLYDLRGDLDTLQLPGGLMQTWSHDDDGNLTLTTVGHTSPADASRRQTTLQYDARGKVLSTANATGLRDTVVAAYSGLGHLVSDQSFFHKYIVGHEWRDSTQELFENDALGNKSVDSTLSTSVDETNGGETLQSSIALWAYEPLTGRLAAAVKPLISQIDTMRYDAAGNTVFTWQTGSHSSHERLWNRASYYAADGRLRSSDYRVNVGGSWGSGATSVFEMYRYDALGRRVMVRDSLACLNVDSVPCSMSTVRRTIWDGEQELDEIQVPDSLAEDDTVAVHLAVGLDQFNIDQNPYFGRVSYTFGVALDQPLSLTRLDYVDAPFLESSRQPVYRWSPFTIIPLWNVHGRPDFGIFAQSATDSLCTTYGSVHRCVSISWPLEFRAYGLPTLDYPSWHGTLLEDKHDKAGTLYRRARVYDPVSGRFTQEDPIGLAGGLNVYGFANGDPVNYSDPFGLCPPWNPNDFSDCGVGSSGWFANRIATGKGNQFLNNVGGVAATMLETAGYAELAAIGTVSELISGPPSIDYPADFQTKNTEQFSAKMNSERDARNLARTKLGKDPVEVGPNKWRSRDGVWQYRAKPGDVSDKHIHLERLDPRTGEVLQNWHLRW